jgi:chromate transporter
MSDTPSLGSMARYFLRLGLIGFGGPPAHIALMRQDLVERQRWISAPQFTEDLATANLLPGPTSTELAIYIGYRLHGVRGALTSGALFILPAFLIVFALAALYRAYGSVAWFQVLLSAVKPVALALVVSGVLQLGKAIPAKWRDSVVFFAALGVLLLLRIDVVLVFLLAGALALALSARQWSPGRSLLLAAPGLAAPVTAVTGVTALAVFWAFLKIGVVIYGGGYALTGILQQEFVNALGWISARELLDGIAIGQSTPGPVFTTATFIGYLVGGPAGAIAATVGIFAPAFVFVIFENVLFGRIKQNPVIQQFLSGVNAAVVASLVVSAAQLASSALIDVFSITLACIAFAALVWKKIDAHLLVGAALLIGVIRFAIS